MPATNLLPWSRPAKHPVVSGMVIDISDLGRGFVFVERLGDAYGDHSYSSRHTILPPRLSVWVCVGVCGYGCMHAPVYPVASGCGWLECLCSCSRGQNRLLCVDSGDQEASVENCVVL